MQFHTYEITNNRYLRLREADSISPEWLTDDIHRWIDITEFQEDELRALLAPLNLHSDIADACSVPHSYPLVINLEQTLFVSIPVQSRGNCLTYLSFLCAPTTLITIQHDDIFYMDNFANYYKSDRRLIVPNTAGLMLELIDAAGKRMVQPFFLLRTKVVAMTEQLEEDASEIDMDHIIGLAREAVQIEIVFQDHQYCLSELQSSRSESLAMETIRPALTALIANTDRGTSAINGLQARIRDLNQYHLLHVEETTNNRLSVLTLLSAIYLPPTLIAGIYGMNFTNIPIIGMDYGYVLVMGAMIALVGGQIAFFRYRGWFK